MLELQPSSDAGKGALAATFIINLNWRYLDLAMRVVHNSTRDVDQGLPLKGEWLARLRELVGSVCEAGEHGRWWLVRSLGFCCTFAN